MSHTACALILHEFEIARDEIDTVEVGLANNVLQGHP